jgi:GAF domain-containing protein
MPETDDNADLPRDSRTTRSELKSIFNREGLRSAVVFLNSLTNHRFTSVYRFDGPTLHNITLYDRENPQIENCEDLPVLASYCVFVRELGTAFQIGHAECDERVNGHSKQKTIQRYCGVPLLDDKGRMFGTICHFDVQPGEIKSAEVELLEYLGYLMNSQE